MDSVDIEVLRTAEAWRKQGRPVALGTILPLDWLRSPLLRGARGQGHPSGECVIRLLLDQGLPRSTALKLRERGWDVVHVGEIGSNRATDQEILQRGRTDGRVVVTLDADFQRILVLSAQR